MIRSKEGPELSGKMTAYKGKYICYGYVYYNRELFKSGRNPIYKTTCRKDKSIKFEESYYTPKDCPFLEKEKRKDKINN